ncbi:hypothetical protein CHS0354_042101 [Potamilus streckersoni]|uniref:Protein-tyrosine-phosphatase n=1 Tax=Potamilus streckersoni TaxID=2493646 RepID=A0AAE0TQB3_9BIVA|nr:hypothetical protein CHS0354_042101 [Potamilus streckersoni]
MRIYMFAHRTCDLQLTQHRPLAHLLCLSLFWGLNFLHCVSFTAALPNPPVKLRASEITADSLKLTWEPGGMGPVQSYTILYKPKHFTGDYAKIVNIRLTEYTIDQLQAYTQYEFRVLASNNLGDGIPSSPIEVVTGELVWIPPSLSSSSSSQTPGSAPRNVNAVPVSSQTIMVHWEEPEIPNGVIQGYKIFYTLKPDLPIVLWDTHDVTVSGTKTTTISSLEPNRTYTLSMLAFSNMGQGPLSETIQVMTTQGVPLQPRNLHAIAVAPNEIEIKWDAPLDANKIISYTLYYNDSKQRLNGEITINPPSTKYKLTDLTPDTVYHIQLSARSASGEGVRTPTVQVKTPQFVPSAAPQAVSGKSINSRSVEVTWKPPPPDKQNGRIVGYKILFVENSSRSTEKDAQVEDVASEARSVLLQSLSTWTVYKIWVLAFTSVGDGPLSEPIWVRTDEDVPGEPKRVKVEAVNSTTIFVEWHPPQAQERNGIIRGYYVFYVEVDNNDEPIQSTEKRIDTEDGNKMDAVIVNLKPDTRYHVQVAGYTRRGDGIRSKPRTITTKGAVPTAPRNLQAELIQAEPPQVQVSWHRPEEIHGNLAGYKLYWGRIGELYREIILMANQQSYIATLLDRGATYEFRVLARNQVDYGERAVTTIETPDGREETQLESGEPPTPDNVKVQRTSPTTIQVTWDEPPPDSDIESYRVYYNNLVVADMSLWKTIDTDGPTTVTQITNLDVKTSYAVRVQAKSVNGRWSNISQAVITDFMPRERPEMVQNFQASGKSSRQLVLSWDAPRKKNVNNYLLKYMGTKSYRENGFVQSSNAPLQEVKIPGQLETYTVRNLVPKMKYEFNMSAIFQDGTMGEETQLIVETRIEAPQKVEAPKIQKITGGKITLRLSAANEMYGPLSHYEVIVVHRENTTKLPKDFTLEELTREQTPVTFPAMQPYIAAKFTPKGFPSEFTLGTGGQVGGYNNRPLDPDRSYRVFLRAYTVKTSLYKSSDYSDLFQPRGKIDPIPSHSPNVPPDPIQDPVPVTDGDKNLMIIIIVCASGGLIVIGVGCAIFIVYMRRKGPRMKKAPEPTSKLIVDNIPPHPSDPVEMRRQHYQTPAMISHPPIPIHMLAEHIENLKTSDNLKFSQEYESIEPGQQFTWDNSNLEYNKPKNRYANVIAYDHSRVILQPVEGLPGSDYINANYMDGYRKQNAYIATQGALPETFGDFWRMIWEQRCATIVMMTRLEERNRIKCDQYWPSRGAETYGLMHILLVEITELATYTIRTFHIQRYGVPEKREVRQFQFTAWPDHGVPDHPTPLLMFMRRVKASNPPDAGPVVVHCSAGVGRTGAFIVIDAMLERIKHEKTVDIYGHVTCLRAQRNYMVQTEDQYIFIHDALLEAVTCGNTEVPARNLSAHIQKLMQPEPGETVTGMELEFKRLANMKASPNRFVSANLPVNKFKNRLVNILPYESTRVALQPIRGVDGSDYINASFIDGYRYRKAYVATQGPLADTTEDFWRMLWEHNSTIIVMLTKLREMGREKCHQYWPSERSARYQYFVVDPMAEYNMPQYILREFKVTDARDGQSRTIRQFQFTDWPEQGVPKSGEGFIDFIGQVHKTKEQFGQEGPITVHCSAGVGRTGVFITLSIVLERMRYEGVVDMFQTVKMLRTQRPAMVQTEDQYQFCYRAALEYLGSFDHYAN